ncbi:hypothetical protein [Armatimonas sp.]|uniref:hypothetical protein n=1 Tax=Armatimonas sp. TaxID=1872638 RepID=UPI00286ABD00|nr:hypothetical protein [Armatimonas sp.]
MRPKNNTALLLAVVGVCLGGMVILNRAQFENRPKSENEIRQEEENKAAAAAPHQTQTYGDAPSLEGELLGLPPDASFGTKGSNKVVTLGYSWSPEVQAEPQKAVDSLKELRTYLDQVGARMNMRFRLVNTDVQREVPEGVSLDGKVLMEMNLATLTGKVAPFARDLMQKLQPDSAPTTK